MFALMNSAPAELLHALMMQHFSHQTLARRLTTDQSATPALPGVFTTSANHKNRNTRFRQVLRH
jgi:CheY-like chemotaxis protein